MQPGRSEPAALREGASGLLSRRPALRAPAPARRLPHSALDPPHFAAPPVGQASEGSDRKENTQFGLLSREELAAWSQRPLAVPRGTARRKAEEPGLGGGHVTKRPRLRLAGRSRTTPRGGAAGGEDVSSSALKWGRPGYPAI